MTELAGYVTDVPYVFGFKPMLAPAWLDLVAIIGGVTPPARADGFALWDVPGRPPVPASGARLCRRSAGRQRGPVRRGRRDRAASGRQRRPVPGIELHPARVARASRRLPAGLSGA